MVTARIRRGDTGTPQSAQHARSGGRAVQGTGSPANGAVLISRRDSPNGDGRGGSAGRHALPPASAVPSCARRTEPSAAFHPRPPVPGTARAPCRSDGCRLVRPSGGGDSRPQPLVRSDLAQRHRRRAAHRRMQVRGSAGEKLLSAERGPELVYEADQCTRLRVADCATAPRSRRRRCTKRATMATKAVHASNEPQ